MRHNVAGYDSYFTVGGGATAAGRPLAGLAGFAQGQGAAIGGTVKSNSAATFNIPAGPANVLSITVHGDVLPDIPLTAGAAVPIDTLLADINAGLATIYAGLATPPVPPLLHVSREGDRVVIATANRGQADTRLLIGGGAAAAFNFRRLDGAAQGAGVDGLGRNEPAFVQSEVGPFTVEEGANFAFVLNNGAAGIALADLVVSCTTAALGNLQQVTAENCAMRSTPQRQRRCRQARWSPRSRTAA